MRTWFITGVSTGFGRAIANAALVAGDRVVGTPRYEDQRRAFAAPVPGRPFGVILDVTDDTRSSLGSTVWGRAWRYCAICEPAARGSGS
jgi:NAD(P)-dependent dehydrogenase (short-subunit alcohol dehydrogenase family)